MAQITKIASSLDYSTSLAAPLLQNSATANRKLHKMTTTASNICHQRMWPVLGFLKYLDIPTNFNLHMKSPAIRTFNKSSRKINQGLSATLNPSIIVMRISIKDITSSDM